MDSQEKGKVNIITIIDNTNFGTYLQAFALARTIDGLGYTVKIIDYCRKHQSHSFLLISSLKTTRNPLKWINRIINWGGNYLLREKDKRFLKKYLTKKKYYSFEELKKYYPKADIYITGSDQVWNSIHNRGIDKSYYWGFVPSSSLKISYAASIGMPFIPEEEKKETFNLLSEYRYISVREHSAENILKELNIKEDKITTVLDPTLLLRKNEWLKFMSKRLIKEPYMIVYSVETKEQDKLISQIAYKIAKEKGLKIAGVYYGGKKNRIDNTDFNFYRSTPPVFLSLFYYADYCVVSSFHGTAFSINFQKDFLTVTPGRFNSRVNNLLEICNLQDRLVLNESYNINNGLVKINYEKVNISIEKERKNSLNFLLKALEV